MTQINLGNIVGIIRSVNPPQNKPYVIWGKITNPQQPLIVDLFIYSGSGDPSSEANWNILKENIDVTIEFEGKTSETFRADYDKIKINSVTKVHGNPTINITVGGNPYTFETEISLGSLIKVEVDGDSTVRLNMTK